MGRDIIIKREHFMPPQILVKDKKYKGLYVALKSFNNNTVVASGTTPLIAQKKALAAGIKNPVILFVPKKPMVQIY